MSIVDAVDNRNAHSTQRRGGIDPLVAVKQKVSAMDKLFDEVRNRFGLTEEETRDILKAKGLTFNPARYNEYVAIVRWECIQQGVINSMKNAQHEQTRINYLLGLEKTLVIRVDPDCWRYDGSQEAIDAHWELEEIRRQETMRMRRGFQRRYQV